MGHGSTVRLPAPPGLLRQVRLKLWLRNYFPGQVVKLQLSTAQLTVATRWVMQDQTAWRGGPRTSAQLSGPLSRHRHAFPGIGPLQPLDHFGMWLRKEVSCFSFFMGGKAPLFPDDEVYSVLFAVSA